MTLYNLLTNINELTEVTVFAWSANRSLNIVASGTALDICLNAI